MVTPAPSNRWQLGKRNATINFRMWLDAVKITVVANPPEESGLREHDSVFLDSQAHAGEYRFEGRPSNYDKTDDR